MFGLILNLFLTTALANPPVIWQGDEALFINPGSIIVPGLTPAGVCKVDGAGLFSTGNINLATEVTGTLPIANGGTGQTTANAALNALLPNQAGNAGKFLQTDGTNTSWQTASGAPSGTPNRFAYFDGSGNLASLNNWVTNTYLGSTVSIAPSISDSGLGQSKIYGQKTITVTPTNNITTDFQYGQLDQTNLDSTFSYNGFTNHESMLQQTGLNDITADAVNFYPRVHLGVGGVSSSQDSWVVRASSRISGTHTANSVNGVSSDITTDSGSTIFQAKSFVGNTYIGGTADYAYGHDQTVNIDGVVNINVTGYNLGISAGLGASVQDITAINSNPNLNILGNYMGLRAGYTGTIGGGSTDLSLYHEGVITSNGTFIDASRNGANQAYFTVLNANINNASPTTNDFNVVTYTNGSSIGGSFTGINLNQASTVSNSFSALNSTIGANVGNGGGDNIQAVNISIASTALIDANASFYNIFNAGDFTGPSNNSITALNFNNQGPGYRVTGFNMYNNKDMDEEIRGIFINSEASNARTKTLIDLQSSGNTTDDFQALRINMASETSSSTTAHPTAISTAGGALSLNGTLIPFNGFGVDLGNYISNTATINSGSPLTGTDLFVQLVQSNLIANDDIATGPFGLNTTMLGASSQISVGSGKTIPLMRSMFLGTSVPSGSGGTITEHVVLDIVGLPSFGGSVTNPTRTAIQDALLVGQEFCDGATDCWFLRNQDDASENHLFRLNINTTSKKNAANTRLEVKNGHWRSDQTTAPTTTVNANAGTGATCTVSGATDTAGTIELTTGSGAWAAGVQCAINFNLSYNTLPRCNLTPGSSTAALAALNTYLGKSTTNISINFVNPDITATTYQWDYMCVETN